MLFGHPKTGVGTAGDDAGLGIPLAQLGELFDRRRRKPATPIVFERQRLLAPETAQLLDRLGLGGRKLIVRASAIHLLCRIDDRAVAGAPAEIAGERVVDFLPARLSVVRNRAKRDMTKPGVQNPHCEP